MRFAEKSMLLALLLPAIAHASGQTMSLEEALGVQAEGASRFMQPLSEAPADVTVIAAEDIRRYGYRTLAEALKSAPGVYATDGRDYTWLGIRGFSRPGDYNTRILLLSDGLRRNDPVYNQAMVGTEAPLDLDWVKQIEFVPGAASSLYGGNALFGIVNAVLWSGADLDGSRISAGLGSDGLARVSLLSGHRGDDGSDWVGGIAVYQKRGADIRFPEFAVPGISDGTARDLDGERHLKAFAKYLAGDWRFNFAYLTRRKVVPTAYYGTLFNTPGNYVVDDAAYADVTHAAALDAGWSRYLRISFGASRFEGQYVYAGSTAREDSAGRWLSGEYRLAYSGIKGHKLMFGVEGETLPHLDQRGIDFETASVYLDDRRSGGSAGLYAQDEWQLSPRWMLNLGARADHLRDYGGVFSPRAALIYSPTAETSVKLIHGRAFRPANVYERFYNDAGFSQKANPGLLPERIVSNELALKFPIGAHVRGGTNIYQYRLDHLIEQITDPGDGLMVFANRPTFHARGIEFKAEAVTAFGFRFGAGVGWQQLRQDFAVPVNSPQRLAKLNADGPLFAEGWTVALDLQGIGPRATRGGAVPGYVNGNLVLRCALPRKTGEVSLGVYNLADRHYRDPAPPEMTQDALPSDGRQFLLRWETGF